MIRALFVCVALLTGPPAPPTPAPAAPDAASSRIYLPMLGARHNNRLLYYVSTAFHPPSVGIVNTENEDTALDEALFGFIEIGIPLWVPDGRQISIATWDETYDDGVEGNAIATIELIDSVTLQRTTLISSRQPGMPTTTWGYGCLAWSYDSRWLAFCTEDAIYRVSRSGGELRRLATKGSNYRWLPRSHNLVVTLNGRRYLLDADTAAQRQLSASGGAFDGAPDGTQVVVEQLDGLYLVNTSTLSRSKLTGFGKAPVWSPDGRRIAFVAPADANKQHIYLIDLADRRTRQLTSQPISLSGPRMTWAPDSQRLMYVSGSIKLHNVTTNQTETIVCPYESTDTVSAPGVISADGKYVAATCINYDTPHPYIYNFIHPDRRGDLVAGAIYQAWSSN